MLRGVRRLRCCRTQSDTMSTPTTMHSARSTRRALRRGAAAILSTVCALLPVLAVPHTLDAQTIRVLITRFKGTAPIVITAPDLQSRMGSGAWMDVPGNRAVLIDPAMTEPLPSLTEFRCDRGLLTLTQDAFTQSYRGTIMVKPGAAGTLVNNVALEDYLRSVVPSEMPAKWPLEALKAQCVAARSYTLGCLGRHEAEGCDICDSTHCQAYRGAGSETPGTDEAVFQTRGLVLQYGGKTLMALYSADCGGRPNVMPELPPVEPRRDAEGEGPCFCDTNPGHSWSVRFAQKDMLTALGQQEAPIRRIRITERDSSGRLGSLTVVSDAGEMSVTGLELRRRLGLKSTLATFSADAETGDLIISGTGWGHGFGMCQWGARGMASEPRNATYEEILTHYYPGASLQALPTAPEVPGATTAASSQDPADQAPAAP